jgi:hypothetical protein
VSDTIKMIRETLSVAQSAIGERAADEDRKAEHIGRLQRLMDAVPEPTTAFFAAQPCRLVDYHAPTPVMTEYHHTKPVFLQNRLYGKILFPADLWVCSNCHDSIHAWLYWLLGERAQPPYIGRAAKAEAQRTYDWYLTEKERLDATPA